VLILPPPPWRGVRQIVLAARSRPSLVHYANSRFAPGYKKGSGAPKRRIVTDSHVMRLSVEDQRAFAEAIDNPLKPTSALRRAFRRRRELIKESR